MPEAKNINKPMRIKILNMRQAFDSFQKLVQHESSMDEPTTIAIKTMAAGGKHSMVLAVDGSLFTFGYGQLGQLGHRSSKNIYAPKFVQDLCGKKVKQIAAGQNHSILQTLDGNVYVCGSNQDGQLGLGDTETRKGFTHLRSLADKNVYRIFAGGNHSWILLDEIIPMRNAQRPPSPLYGDRILLENEKSPKKESALNLQGGINLTNQARPFDRELDNTQEFQRKAQEDRERKEKMGREAAAQMTKDFVSKVVACH